MEKKFRNRFMFIYCIWMLILSLSYQSDFTNSNDNSEGKTAESESNSELEDHIFYEHIPRHPAREKFRSEIHNPQIKKGNEEIEKEQLRAKSDPIYRNRRPIGNPNYMKEDSFEYLSNDLEEIYPSGMPGAYLNDNRQASREENDGIGYNNNELKENYDHQFSRELYEDLPGMGKNGARKMQKEIPKRMSYDDDIGEFGMQGAGLDRGLHQGRQGGIQGGMHGGIPGGLHNGMPGMYGGIPNRGIHNEMPGGLHGGMTGATRRGGMPGGRTNHGIINENSSTDNNTNTSRSFGIIGGLFNSAYEILMFIFIGGFIYNCFFGKTHNDKFAQAWYNVNKEYFEKRYETVGYTDMKNTEDEEEIKPTNCNMIKENPFVYKLVCTNYRYIKALLILLEFRKRPDAVSMLTSFIVNTKDRIIYEVAIDPIEDVCWMFCICKKRDANNLKNSYSDINFFGKSHDLSVFGEKLTSLTENLESLVEIFQNKNLLSFFKSIEGHIDLIYYTDQQTFCKDKHSLFFSFELHLNKTNGNENLLLEITHFVNLFADTLSQLRFNENVKKEFDKNRVMFERSKMEDTKRKEVEDKERRDFIEQWKIKNKNKYKKPGQKKNKDKKEKK